MKNHIVELSTVAAGMIRKWEEVSFRCVLHFDYPVQYFDC